MDDITQPRGTALDRMQHLAHAVAVVVLGAVALAAAVVLLGLVAVGRDRLEAGHAATPTMRVGGTGTVDVPPTEARMGVELRGCAKGPSGALVDANASFAAVRKAVAATGIPARDIAQGSVRTTREYGAPPRWCTHVEASVRVRDLGLLDDVVQAVGTSRRGVAGLSGPDFEYGAEGPLERRALAAAVAAARGKADDAARRTGMRVTGVQTMQEGAADVLRPSERGDGEREVRYDAAAPQASGGAADVAAAKSVAISQAAGRATARATVAVVFTLESRDD